MVLIPSVVLRFYGALSLGFGMIGTCGEITPLLDDQWIEKNRLGGFIVMSKYGSKAISKGEMKLNSVEAKEWLQV